jgi:hypothetical protein
MPQIAEQDRKIIWEAQEKIVLNPLLLIEKGWLKIRTKAGEMVELQPNLPQRILLRKIEEIKAKGKPVRLLILKARQEGVSTLIEGIIYAHCSQRPNLNALVMADDIDGSNYLFSMQKLFQEMMPPYFRPEPEHTNEKKLSFKDLHSQILIDTASNIEAGRKYTFQYAHLSECALYSDLKELMLGLLQAIPNVPETMVFLESTANGRASHFWELWEETERGHGEWETLFIPWFALPEYSRPLENGGLYPIEDIPFSNTKEKQKFYDEEEALQRKFNVTKEQLSWRRWCIVNQCGSDLNSFSQEYPSTSEEAFISSGEMFFDTDSLKRQVEEEYVLCNLFKYDGGVEARPDKNGKFRVYEEPRSDDSYIVAGDVAEGVEGGDMCGGVALSMLTNNTVVDYCENIDPDTFAEDLILMAEYCKQGLLVTEQHGINYSVCSYTHRHYGNVYKMMKLEHGNWIEPEKAKVGWDTNSVTRPLILNQMATELREKSTNLRSKRLIDQCWSFIRNPKKQGKPEAGGKAHDDLIISRSIAGMVRLQKPIPVKTGEFDYTQDEVLGKDLEMVKEFGYG